jgi:hypothetical protein
MRLWSLHPKYLDRMGLLAVWREGLLAKKVLGGKTKGYRNHPQLARFRGCKDPLAMIDSYLLQILLESKRRGYSFDKSKICADRCRARIPVTAGQIEFEAGHLLKKLRRRDKKRSAEFVRIRRGRVMPSPVFREVAGKKEHWER